MHLWAVKYRKIEYGILVVGGLMFCGPQNTVAECEGGSHF